jgi:hypothetical protein
MFNIFKLINLLEAEEVLSYFLKGLISHRVVVANIAKPYFDTSI